MALMANLKHLSLLQEGREVWNKWRTENEDIDPDLSHLKILAKANLGNFNLSNVDFRELILVEAKLDLAYLGGANLTDVDLMRASCHGTSFVGANLTNADFSKARFSVTIFGRIHIAVPELFQMWSQGTVLSGTNFSEAEMSGCVFSGMDLSCAKGLETIHHRGASSLDIETIYRSNGKIPNSFLSGAGVPEPFIQNMTALVAAMEPIQFYSCFISYSTIDQKFADRLYAHLRENSVRVWFAPEDLKIGERFRNRIDESIHTFDKTLLILSQDSIASAWVEDEVEAALERERRENRLVLFPIRIDDAVMNTDQAWASHLKQKRQIGDFRLWKDPDNYQKSFQRLLRDLKTDVVAETGKRKSPIAGSLSSSIY